jgi:hypothetical protein
MSVQKIQANRALRVIPSDNCVIPMPYVIETGRNTSVVANQLVESTGTFVTFGIKTGDVVYNITDNTAATVVNVINETSMTLNANIFTAINKDYIVYQASPETTLGNTGCLLYIGGAGNVNLNTTGDDIVTFVGLNTGQFVPVQCLKVSATGTTATNIIALW